jgi:oligopeptide/dipeptide ABC transporter ATP-binding protein
VSDTPIRDLLRVDNLIKHFPPAGGPFRPKGAPVRAVDGVSFAVRRGETLALIGESGCGKTTTGELILLLQPATSGEVEFMGRSILKADQNQIRELRQRMQVVFQNPRSSLNPRMRIHQILAEPFVAQGQRRGVAAQTTNQLLEMVGLKPHLAARFPHELSGGQAQRVAIARALAFRPDFIVLDEPTSALDVSVQAQVINLLQELQDELGLTYLFISHDLRIVRHLADRIGVMYLGKIVELGPTTEMYRTPLHPYTQALLSAVPPAHPRLRRPRTILSGDVPSPAAIPSGCRFRTRCPLAVPICAAEVPAFRQVRPGHWSACHFAQPDGTFAAPRAPHGAHNSIPAAPMAATT